MVYESESEYLSVERTRLWLALAVVFTIGVLTGAAVMLALLL